jgi:hypothetical protein
MARLVATQLPDGVQALHGPDPRRLREAPAGPSSGDRGQHGQTDRVVAGPMAYRSKPSRCGRQTSHFEATQAPATGSTNHYRCV